MKYRNLISLMFLCVIAQGQQTYKEYPVYRVLIAKDSVTDLRSGHERYKRGDIISARPERPYIEGLGKKEVDKFIAIRVYGFSREILDSLSISNEVNGAVYQKRRFQIRFSDLKLRWPAFDSTQIHVLGRGNEFVAKNGLFDARGLIWDKKYMRYWR